MTPTIIGIGAQKCASSWVYSVLGAHPQIGVSEPKEIDFFSYYFDRGYQWYEAHFSDFGDLPQRFENSPSYFYDPRSPERAKAYAPDLRVLVMLRNPIARAYSNHLHEVVKGHIPELSFEEGLENNPTYLEQGRYATHLKRWLDVFGKDAVKVMFAEDVAKDAGAAARELYLFANVDEDYQTGVISERRNESDRARYPVVRKALRGGGDWLRKRGLEEQLMWVKSKGPVKGVLRANSIDVREEIADMRDDTRLRLIEFFAEEVSELKSLLPGRVLPWSDWD